MQHIAIMKKSWGLTQKILSGQKTIESRWYKAKVSPWNRINKSDTIYFKDSGDPVTIKADVKKVLQFSNLTPEKVKGILDEYADPDGITREDIPSYYELFKDKNYCILIFLSNPRKIKPFQIDKTGYGLMSAWICADNIDKHRA